MKTTMVVAAVAAGVLLPAVPAQAQATADPSPISRLWLSADRTSFTGRCVNGYPVDSTGRRVPFRFTLSVEVRRAPVSLRWRLYAANRAYRWHQLDFNLEGGGQRMAPQTNLIVHQSVRRLSAAVYYDDGIHYSNPVDVSVRCVSLRDDVVPNPVGG
ncbi:hypothetical protein ACIBHX_48710 [Nonomuraea sp. NPDC050536]|uniref:hypothetical protein n=1 Tax=Nonomuraea sp. NPDC050536 TaxID=3364366 RepID=UPI0037C97F72